MTSTALRKLLGPKKKAEPRPVQWIKSSTVTAVITASDPAVLRLR